LWRCARGGPLPYTTGAPDQEIGPEITFLTVRSWDKGAQLLALLLRLHELLRLPQVVLVYVSNATPDAHYSMTGSIEPNHIYFPDYTVDEVRDILMRGHPNPKLYSSFLR
jgi:origin recognition complex subunit 5